MADEDNYSVQVPSSIFKDRTLKPLEAVVEFLKEKEGLGFSEIARLISRDSRTIWTVYNRVKKKRRLKHG